MLKLLKVIEFNHKKFFVSLLVGIIFYGLLFSINQVYAYWYFDYATEHRAYYTDCGTGIGGMGKIVACEPAPLFVPNDCYFPLNQTNYQYSSVFLNWFGDFYGTSPSIAYQNIYFPDTNFIGTYAIPETGPFSGQQPLSNVSLANGTVITGYTVVYPSPNMNASLHNQLKVSCWRTSLDIIGNQNGGFEAPTITTAYDGKTYIPNWYISEVNGTLSSEDIWLKTGNYYLNITRIQYFSGEHPDQTITKIMIPFYLPVELGGIYNLSYKVNSSFYWYPYASDNPRDLWLNVYIDEFLVDTKSIHWDYGEYQVWHTKGINGSFSYNINLINLLGNIHTLTFEFNASCFGVWRLESKIYLDDVHLTSLCPNCTQYLDINYAIPPPTTTTTLFPTTTIQPFQPVVNTTPFAEVGAGWLTPFFTPFFFVTIFVLGISAIITKKVSEYGGGQYAGAIFLGSLLLLIIYLTVSGFYPAWIGIVFIIIAGFLFAKFIIGLI
jgi:hypothetical protein